ncbi:MAG: formylglycine-generating enzyme family protein [Bradymonadia bacterium]
MKDQADRARWAASLKRWSTLNPGPRGVQILGAVLVLSGLSLWMWIFGHVALDERLRPASETAWGALAPTMGDDAWKRRLLDSASSTSGDALRPKMRVLPTGWFMMGSPRYEEGRDEWHYEYEPLHRVELTHTFALGETEVTQGQWKAVMGSNPSRFKACGDDCPVERVGWNDALAYLNRLSDLEGLEQCYEEGALKAAGCKGYRLPTEEEWEYAARAGTQNAIYKGKWFIKGEHDAPALDPIAWYGGNSGVTYPGAADCAQWLEKQYPEQQQCGTHPVAGKEPNAWGMYDMLGNVSEWVEYDGNSPRQMVEINDRVLRGGAWSSAARVLRAASFSGDLTYSPGSDIMGLRPARSIPAIRPEMITIQPGEITMGSPEDEIGRSNDETIHTVRVTHRFSIGETEVTQGQWRAVMGSNPSAFQTCGDDCPVERVTWFDAVRYLNRVSRIEGLSECYEGDDYDLALTSIECEGYRLPTEAEWALAARPIVAGDAEYRLNEVGWFSENSNGSPHPVKQLKPNGHGLYDMLGNVWEWTQDWYAPLPERTEENPEGPSSGITRVRRGGCWKCFPARVRAASRGGDVPAYKFDALGLRPVRTLPGPKSP